MNFSAKDFDKFLSESSVKPSWVMIHPLAWNGYWGIKWKPKKFFRWLGRKLNNKYIYWLGLPLYWIDGLKEYVEIYISYDKIQHIINENGHTIFLDLENDKDY